MDHALKNSKGRGRVIILAALLSLALLAACEINSVECDKECQDYWMDGAPDDSSVSGLDSYHYYQVSKRKDTIPQSVKDTIPVIIAAHGYSASTYEWLEFRRYAGDTLTYVDGRTDSLSNPKVLVSLVLLGGHGVSIEKFEESTWQDWGLPILDEYKALRAQGYKNISLAGSSTGCPLILDHISRHRMDSLPPKHLFLIDPIIVPSSKLLSMVALVGPIIGNSPADNNTEEKRHWYTNRPQETLDELYTLTNLIKNRLEDGINLPKGTRAKVWKAKKDALADPISALLLYKGLKPSMTSHIDVEMMDTRKHVFTRLAGREGNTKADTTLQVKTFQEMLDRAESR